MFLKNIREQKMQLRAKHKKLRTLRPADVKNKLDKKISETFLSSKEYKQCEILFAFVSSEIEVDTSDIISNALADGKKLALPKCRNKLGEMDFYFVTSVNQLKKGTFSIPEPDSAVCTAVDDSVSGLCLVPGLCYDMHGYRIGFGKGYYDRFLQKFSGISVGLCYTRCIEQKLPRGVFDKPVDILITEKYTNYTHNVFAEE